MIRFGHFKTSAADHFAHVDGREYQNNIRHTFLIMIDIAEHDFNDFPFDNKTISYEVVKSIKYEFHMEKYET